MLLAVVRIAVAYFGIEHRVENWFGNVVVVGVGMDEQTIQCDDDAVLARPVREFTRFYCVASREFGIENRANMRAKRYQRGFIEYWFFVDGGRSDGQLLAPGFK